jgi:hypothetical protein
MKLFTFKILSQPTFTINKGEEADNKLANTLFDKYEVNTFIKKTAKVNLNLTKILFIEEKKIIDEVKDRKIDCCIIYFDNYWDFIVPYSADEFEKLIEEFTLSLGLDTQWAYQYPVYVEAIEEEDK